MINNVINTILEEVTTNIMADSSIMTNIKERIGRKKKVTRINLKI